MRLEIKAPVLALEAGEVVTLDDAAGTRIQARQGVVWVTQEGDLDDHILGPGEALVLECNGRTVVQAMRAAHVALH